MARTTQRLTSRVRVLLAAFAFSSTCARAQGNTACASSQLDWYTSVVGETPCTTYQRLRQICNGDYQVPVFGTTPPGDTCDDQISDCCCNTIAFQLSMLCMNCQQDKLAGNQPGIDASNTDSYSLYKGKCGPGLNQTLPANVQRAVCNENIRLENNLYGGWKDGTWFYTNWRETVELMHAVNNNNTFTHCANQISPSAATPTSSSSTTSSGAADAGITVPNTTQPTSITSAGLESHDGRKPSSPAGIIAGGVVGGTFVVLALLAGVLCWKRRVPRRRVRVRGSAISTNSANHTFVQAFTWSENPVFLPPSNQPSAPGTRHTDAGVLIPPHSRPISGSLPPAYRSWEDAPPANVVSENPSRSPLVPLRLKPSQRLG